MKVVTLLGALAILGSVGAGCRRASADVCLTTCEARSKELGCKRPDRCAENCAKARQAVACKKQMDTFMQCATRQPKQEWECGPGDFPVTRGEACAGEADGVQSCLRKSRGKL